MKRRAKAARWESSFIVAPGGEADDERVLSIPSGSAAEPKRIEHLIIIVKNG